MPMLTKVLCAGLIFGLAACSPAGDGGTSADEPVAAPQQRQVQPTWREDRLALGRETYEQACASCHDSGEEEAPVTGNRDDWARRSDLWQAVLASHAKSGYFDMPGKGGQPQLSDQAVEAATEYMMGLTFPELPTD